MSEQVMGGAPSAPVSGGESSSQASGYGGANGSSIGSSSSSGVSEQAQTDGIKSSVNQEAKPAPRSHKLKVDGMELELSEEEVLKRAQMASSASKRFEDAAKLKKEVDTLKAKLKENPLAFLEDQSLGLSEDQVRNAFENWYKEKYIDPSRLTPEQQEAAKLKKELESYKKQDETRKAEAEKVRVQKETEHWTQVWQQRIVEGMAKADLPKNELAVGLIAQQLRNAAEAGIEIPIEAAAGLVKDRLSNISKHFMAQMDGDQLIKFVGEELVNKIRKADLARLQKPGQPPSFGGQRPQVTSQDKPLVQTNKVVKMSEVSNYFDKLYSNK